MTYIFLRRIAQTAYYIIHHVLGNPVKFQFSDYCHGAAKTFRLLNLIHSNVYELHCAAKCVGLNFSELSVPFIELHGLCWNHLHMHVGINVLKLEGKSIVKCKWE